MIKIKDVLSPEAIIIDCEAQSKHEVITLMGEFMASCYHISDPASVIQKIEEREREVSTGIGFGIAIPHTRSNLVDRICMVAARCARGIEFEAIDDNPVNLIFMMVSPMNASEQYRNLLSVLSKIISYEEMRNNLLAASDARTFFSLLLEGEKKYIGTS